jgi:hypothetical protein
MRAIKINADYIKRRSFNAACLAIPRTFQRAPRRRMIDRSEADSAFR